VSENNKLSQEQNKNN